jgi:endonuclease/exonuclease/phosphatase family metal-dependent hydrolase
MRLFLFLAMSLLTPLTASAYSRKGGETCELPLFAMTYNIRLDTSADGDNAWAKRKHFLIGQIVTMRPHILGLQEVLPNQQDDLKAVLTEYDFIGAGRDDGKSAGEASPLIIDRHLFKISASGTFWLSPTPFVPSMGWDAAFKRVASWAHLTRRSDGAKLLVVNSHWDHIGLVARKESGAQILDWIARNRFKGEHVVLMGDFNADDAEESVAQLARPATGHDALVNTRRAAANGNFGPSFSFNAFDPFPASGKLIDHIFVSPDIAVLSQGVIAQHENGRVASDHFPVVALLDLASPGNRSNCRINLQN